MNTVAQSDISLVNATFTSFDGSEVIIVQL